MKCVVTGGGGFVGSALCSALVREGHSVVAIGRREAPALKALGVQTVQHDLATTPEALATLCADAAVVFHTAAHVAMWGRYEEFLRGNILATRHCIAACRAARVPVLIYTNVKRGVTPDINALSALLVLVTVVAIVAANALLRPRRDA